MDFQYNAEKMLENTKDFFSSNSLVAHLVFLVLVIILFIILLRIGTAIVTYIFSPKPDPYLIKGLINAQKLHKIPQDPKTPGSIPVLRSVDQYNGIEFTWSTWIFIDDVNYEQNRYKHVFHKGNNNIGSDGLVQPNNAPGLYISPVNYPNMAEISLLVRMNIFTNENSSSNLTQVNEACINVMNAQENAPHYNPSSKKETLKMCQQVFPNLNSNSSSKALAPNIYDDIEIPDVPLNKWVSVIIRCSNNDIIDVYINGRLAKRQKLSGIARQNYDDVYVAMNGGFSGNISNLRYYNYAIGTQEINWLVSSGPDTSAKQKDALATAKPYYLANEWYFNERDNLYSSP